MATIFKKISSNDTTSTRTLLHENVPVTGTIVSGSTYEDSNIKNFSHGMFQSVYDYPYLSSSANHLFDLSCGYKSGSASNTQNSKKQNLYAQMAQVLVGHDAEGNVREFDRDGDLSGGDKISQAYFLNLSRLLTKDEIKKGTLSFEIGSGSAYSTPFSTVVTVSDAEATTSYRTNSPAGDYAVLYTGSAPYTAGTGVGLVYYQAGVIVLTSSLFGDCIMNSDGDDAEAMLATSEISASADSIRHRFKNLSFNNTIELNSTIYFCHANHNEFNYSSNPTYLSESKIRVKDQAIDSPSSYITSVGLYSADNALLATAKLSEPLKKDPSNSLTLRVRLDY
tara:strand:- start:762 stop:1772 length:1011 start_codon:yes stop_codon:yes gene_type:complete